MPSLNSFGEGTPDKAQTNVQGDYQFHCDTRTCLALAAIISLEDYGSRKLELWAWKAPALQDLEINLRFDRIRVNGLTASDVPGTGDGPLIHSRRMDLPRVSEQGEVLRLRR